MTWEYLTVYADLFSNGLRVTTPDQQKPVPLAAHLNALGAQGWEVVGLQQVGNQVLVLLKRPTEWASLQDSASLPTGRPD